MLDVPSKSQQEPTEIDLEFDLAGKKDPLGAQNGQAKEKKKKQDLGSQPGYLNFLMCLFSRRSPRGKLSRTITIGRATAKVQGQEKKLSRGG